VSAHQRRLTWSENALAELADLVEFMPAEAWRAVDAMERMAEAGFNYGRATSEPGVWYLPVGHLGVFYTDGAGTLTGDRVVDARLLRELP